MLRLIAIFTIAALLGLVVQATVVHGLFPSAIAPNFILILVVFLGLAARNSFGAVAAFALGVLADFASGEFIGPNAAGSIMAFLFTALISEKIYADRIPAIAILIFCSSLAKSLTFLVMLRIYLGVEVSQLLAAGSLETALLEAVFSALIGPVIVRLLHPTRQYIPTAPVASTR